MQFADEEKQKRIDELSLFKITMDMDLPDNTDKAPYEKIYNDCINGRISVQEFDNALEQMLKSSVFTGPRHKDENEISLSYDAALTTTPSEKNTKD